MYKYKQYNNFKELEKKNKKLAAELLYIFDSGDWMEEEIILFNSKKDFALYELQDGWYFDSFKKDYNGAPNPIDFINLTQLGNALINSWDERNHYLTNNNKIIVTY